MKEKGREKEFHYDHSDLMCHQRTACATAVLCTKMANLLLPSLSCDVIFGILRAFSLHQHNCTRTSISHKEEMRTKRSGVEHNVPPKWNQKLTNKIS